jgi:hypothetical protein
MSSAASSTVAIVCALDSSTVIPNSSSRPITISTCTGSRKHVVEQLGKKIGKKVIDVILSRPFKHTTTTEDSTVYWLQEYEQWSRVLYSLQYLMYRTDDFSFRLLISRYTKSQVDEYWIGQLGEYKGTPHPLCNHPKISQAINKNKAKSSHTKLGSNRFWHNHTFAFQNLNKELRCGL